MEPCRKFVTRVFDRRLSLCEPDSIFKDPKTRLQELLQERSQELPVYSILEVSGPPHKQLFKVQCQIVEGDLSYLGKGSSRRRAEQDAAEKAMLALAG